MEIFVANLHKGIDERLLSKLFEPFGSVTKSTIAFDKITNSSKGYGFVIMENSTEAMRAVQGLDGKEIGGKAINVKESNPTKIKPKNTPREEDIPIEVVNKQDYKKRNNSEGYIKISFNS